jgi:hypothetical protein
LKWNIRLGAEEKEEWGKRYSIFNFFKLSYPGMIIRLRYAAAHDPDTLARGLLKDPGLLRRPWGILFVR